MNASSESGLWATVIVREELTRGFYSRIGRRNLGGGRRME
jgi:hypothetical protein